jgi:hypothetical protein
MVQPRFADALFRCDDSSSLRLPTGAQFIRKLPDDRPLGYLHKLYAPITSDGVGKLQSGFGRNLPKQYATFLAWANGAALFDNSVALFGDVENVTRSVEPAEVTAISIQWENELYSVTESERWQQGWIKIGGIVGWDSRYSLELHESGPCAVRGGAGEHCDRSFEECMARVIARLDPCFTCDGLVDETCAELEGALASLVRAQ